MQHSVALASVGNATHGRAVHEHRRSVATATGLLSSRSALATATVVVLILAAITVAALSLLVQPAVPAPSGWTQVSVQPSASLWSLASAHPVAGLSTAETAALIAEENGLGSGVIHPGQTLSVPSSIQADTAVALR